MTSERFCIISFSADIFLSKYSIWKYSIFLELVFVEISNKYSAQYTYIRGAIIFLLQQDQSTAIFFFSPLCLHIASYPNIIPYAIKHTQKIWQTTLAPDGTSVALALSCGARGAVLAPVFCKTKKDSFIKRMGNIMKQKLLFGFILIIILLKRFQKKIFFLNGPLLRLP